MMIDNVYIQDFTLITGAVTYVIFRTDQGNNDGSDLLRGMNNVFLMI